jgi:diguanylate cyclase (GGDEF)-like protein
MPPMMGGSPRAANSVSLIADAESVFAGWVSTQLARHDFWVDRIAPDQPIATECIAAVFLCDREASIEKLSGALGRSTTPMLVLAATRELAERALPLLDSWHDLALATEPAGAIAWRLNRLIDLARRTALGPQALDPLTGLPNRRTLEREILRVIDALRPGEAVGLLLIDLDGFKPVNDHLGHEAGDRLLRDIGQLISRNLSTGDLAARLGGDEFGCVLKGRDRGSVRRSAQRLLRAISHFGEMQSLADPSMPRVTASAGLTCLDPGAAVDRSMNEARQAWYQAKAAGRDRLEEYRSAPGEAESPVDSPGLQHFENVTKVVTQRLVGMLTSESRKLLDAANQQANTCPMTGLGNRRHFDARLPREIQDAGLRGRPLSIALIDIDRFNLINGTYGWPSGDRTLRAFAQVARANVRPADWVARYAGDEFIIVMPDTELETAVQVAERVRQAFAAATIESVDGRRIEVTLSAGVAQLPAGAVSAEKFVHLASEVLKSKPGGRNRVEVARHDASATVIDQYRLARFVDAQSGVYEGFLSELRRGRKLTHCMWFVFPQLVGLGNSQLARTYGITGREEAAAYLAHPVLGARLRECAAVLEALDQRLSVDDIFDYPDDLKLRSCLTLFECVAESDSVFGHLIDRYFAGTRDAITLTRLRKQGVAHESGNH